MTVPATPADMLTALEYPAAGDPDNVLTAAVTAAYDAAADHAPADAMWLVVNDIAGRLPADATLGDESRNYQRGLAAGIAMALLASA